MSNRYGAGVLRPITLAAVFLALAAPEARAEVPHAGVARPEREERPVDLGPPRQSLPKQSSFDVDYNKLTPQIEASFVQQVEKTVAVKNFGALKNQNLRGPSALKMVLDFHSKSVPVKDLLSQSMEAGGIPFALTGGATHPGVLALVAKQNGMKASAHCDPLLQLKIDLITSVDRSNRAHR